MISAAAYTNGDDVFLAWSSPPIASCWGFAIWRDRKTPGGQAFSGYIHNRVGFPDDNPKPHEHRPSDQWPFQRYTWTDHGVDEGDSVSYIIRPVLRASSTLKADTTNQAVAGPLKVTAAATGLEHAYFNRGVLLSQFVASKLPPNFTTDDLKKLKAELANDADELRLFLTGQLGARLVKLLSDAGANGWHLYAALYHWLPQLLPARQPEERREPAHREGQQEAGPALRREHHEQLPALPVAGLPRAVPGAEQEAVGPPGEVEHLAEATGRRRDGAELLGAVAANVRGFLT